MRATVMHGAGDVRVEEVPDPTMQEPTDAVVRVVRSGICSSDLWAYGRCRPASRAGPMSHEFLGVVEVLGAEVSRLERGDLVVTPGPARRSATCSPQWVIADNATLADGIATAFLTNPPRLNRRTALHSCGCPPAASRPRPHSRVGSATRLATQAPRCPARRGVKALDKEALWK